MEFTQNFLYLSRDVWQTASLTVIPIPSLSSSCEKKQSNRSKANNYLEALPCHKVSFWWHPVKHLSSFKYWCKVSIQTLPIHSKDSSMAESRWGGHGKRGAQQTQRELNAEPLCEMYHGPQQSLFTAHLGWQQQLHHSTPEQTAKAISEL